MKTFYMVIITVLTEAYTSVRGVEPKASYKLVGALSLSSIPSLSFENLFIIILRQGLTKGSMLALNALLQSC